MSTGSTAVRVKRHEFRGKDSPQDAFVVFEGFEDRPFWNREGDGVRFVFTNLTFKRALAFETRGIVTHDVIECDIDEFQRYLDEATRKHTEMNRLVAS